MTAQPPNSSPPWKCTGVSTNPHAEAINNTKKCQYCDRTYDDYLKDHKAAIKRRNRLLYLGEKQGAYQADIIFNCGIDHGVKMMKKSIINSLITAQIITLVLMIVTGSFPDDFVDWITVISVSSVMGIGCGLGSSFSGSSAKHSKLARKNQDQIVIAKINALIAEGAIKPEIGIEVKEAIVNQMSKQSKF
ncbi:hypothetical protein AM228_26355 [Planktothricoides sp. SR001]|uniref:hypothetical protein n=1 Tax=Planktothricoides sp. SR001 TaxID=1705388 RepID=UPI0006C44EFB|nr:hypothetical protein [Planktothricoides sp. SR001]KOR34046.1 hypothetical protein AM228_26355 [Planktothricoides sp. SR001]